LILSKVHRVELPKEDKMKGKIRGWPAPLQPVAEFLKQFSLAGGTHHAAILYGDRLAELKMFAQLMDWEVVAI
jgi:L-arabinose isomerase